MFYGKHVNATLRNTEEKFSITKSTYSETTGKSVNFY